VIPFNLHRRIPLVRRPFYQRDLVIAERDVIAKRLAEAERKIALNGVRQRNRPVQRPELPKEIGEDTRDAQSVVGEYWDQQNRPEAQMPDNSAWWLAPVVIRHINRIVCGEPIDGLHAGFHRRLVSAMANTPHPRRALSIGCGVATKEMDAIADGVAESFECYDLSGHAVEVGRQIAAERGISDKVKLHHADAFENDPGLDFDLVYWNNALHHMLDTREAIQWSRDHLRVGGIFAMDDYVGATRNQHSPELITWGSRVMAAIPEYLRWHWNGIDTIPAVIGVVDPNEQARIDPSECADSASILPSLHSIFPDVEIIKTGGVLYLLALSHTLQNYQTEAELALLNTMLLLDEAAPDYVESQYAVAIARK
jgi:SAM-dependent methyltransferase